jgi:carbamoyl-phosphate synthase large subunit
MTGAGAPGAPGIIHCLKQDHQINITAADADATATGSHLAHDFVTIPSAEDPGFIKKVLQVCKDKNIGLILPLVTKELFPLSKNKKAFEDEGIRILVSHAGIIETVNNKSSCYGFLQSRGIRVPRYRVVKNLEEFIHAAFELGHPQQAFCFKPSISNGSRGVRIVSDSLDESSLLFEQKPYNLNITYAHAIHILSCKPFPELLVSEYLPGSEYSVDCIAENGKAILVMPRSRLKMVNGISVQGKFVNDTAIINYCRSIIEATGLHGNVGIQVKMNSANEPMLLEVNPRVQGTTVSALGAGVNLPLLAVKQELGEKIDPSIIKIKWGTRFSRYWTEVYY